MCAQHSDDVDMTCSDEELNPIAIESETSKSLGSIQLPGAQPMVESKVGEWFIDRAKYIPLRLTFGERKYLGVLDAALQMSEYTDRIDTIGYGLSKPKRIVHQIRELCAIISGLVLTADYKQGQELFTDRDFQSNAEFYQKIFELGRRHKIHYPDKMRTTYRKLIYLLQVSSALRCHCPCTLLFIGQSVSRRQRHAQLLLCQTHHNRVRRFGRTRCSRHVKR